MEMQGSEKSLKNNRNGAADFVLNVLINDDCDVHGQIQHCESGETKYFRSLIEMILLINRKLEQSKFSQPTNQIRSWNMHKFKRG